MLFLAQIIQASCLVRINSTASFTKGFKGKTGTLQSTFTYDDKLPAEGQATSSKIGKLLTVFDPKYSIYCPVSFLSVLAKFNIPFNSRPLITLSSIFPY